MQNINVKEINNQLIIDSPPRFTDSEGEVILRLQRHKDTDFQDIEKEIDIGLNSPISLRNHNEIFDNMMKKYGYC